MWAHVYAGAFTHWTILRSVSMCVSMREWVRECVCAQTREQSLLSFIKYNIFFLFLLFYIYFEIASHTCLDLASLTRLAGWWVPHSPPGIHVPSLPQFQDYKHTRWHLDPFYMGSADQKEVFMLAREALHQISYLPRLFIFLIEWTYGYYMEWTLRFVHRKHWRETWHPKGEKYYT